MSQGSRDDETTREDDRGRERLSSHQPRREREPIGVPMDPLSDRNDDNAHAPEPWTQEGRYIRDAAGAIVVRGKTFADARRIVAAINATRDIPTDALESWLVQDVSNPRTRPDLEVELSEADLEPSQYAVTPPERRQAERRCRERRQVFPMADPPPLVFDRRVMERRLGTRRQT
jgi:hypothetical protein